MTDKDSILQKISEADMILIGLGEEFDDIRVMKEDKSYATGRELLLASDYSWLLPAYQKLFRERKGSQVYNALCGLAGLLKDKNYFVVSISMNDVIQQVPWKEERLVMPCGGSAVKQCINGCEEGLEPIEERDRKLIQSFFETDMKKQNGDELLLGACPSCGGALVLNNIYAEHYDEKGYLKQWELYTKWLQGTLNKRLLILELGVGMQFPSVIRWPFEKVAFFNQKAELYRVNEKLYQLSEELREKGTSISENAIDWLQFLC